MAMTQSLAQSDEEKEKSCRICLDGEDEKDNPLITPCKCSGSMRYVHRACLDEWRMNCFNPKALVGCTTCHTAFTTRYEGSDAEHMTDPDSTRWWVRFARDVAWFSGVRILAFTVTVVAVGFWPQLLLGVGPDILHPNPLVSHMLCGTGTSLAVLGTFVVLQLPGLWQTGEGLRLVLDVWCPRRASGSRGSGLEMLVLVLIVVGLLCCLYFFLVGIVRLFNEGRHEVVRAVRGANQQVRRQVVKEFVVLNFKAAEGSSQFEQATTLTTMAS